jgi:sugar phosphate isomerase/epimerase
MFWTGGDLATQVPPDQTVRMVSQLGVSCGQLGIHPGAILNNEQITVWKTALDTEGMEIVTVFSSYLGESYASISTVQKTVGFIPPLTREEREARTYECSDFASELGVSSLATHIGFVPEDRTNPDYIAVREMVRRVCDYCAQNDQIFALETGQEPARTLRDFIADVDRENLGINFDPANMILYGSGEPLEALEIVREHVVTVHCKDAKWPTERGQWGTETPLGKGDVSIDKFLTKLKEIGYWGPLVIEREITGEKQQVDIRAGIAWLEELRALLPTAKKSDTRSNL